MRNPKSSILIRALSDIRRELTRIADCLEYDLADRGIVTRVPDTSNKEDATVDYVDNEVEWARENIPDFDKHYARVLREDHSKES